MTKEEAIAYLETTTESDGGMSNIDHIIDPGLEEELKSGKHGDYSAWNFHGDVFFKDGQFHCFVMQYQRFQEIISCGTLREVMDECSEKYGAE